MARINYEALRAPYWAVIRDGKDLYEHFKDYRWAFTDLEVIEERSKPLVGKLSLVDPDLSISNDDFFRPGLPFVVHIGYAMNGEFRSYDMVVDFPATAYPEVAPPTIVVTFGGRELLNSNEKRVSHKKGSLRDRLTAVLSDVPNSEIVIVGPGSGDMLLPEDMQTTSNIEYIRTICKELGYAWEYLQGVLTVWPTSLEFDVPGEEASRFHLYYQCGDSSLFSLDAKEESQKSSGRPRAGAKGKGAGAAITTPLFTMPDNSEGSIQRDTSGKKDVYTVPTGTIDPEVTAANPDVQSVQNSRRASVGSPVTTGMSGKVLYADPGYSPGVPLYLWGVSRKHEGKCIPTKITRKVIPGDMSLTFDWEKASAGKGSAKPVPADKAKIANDLFNMPDLRSFVTRDSGGLYNIYTQNADTSFSNTPGTALPPLPKDPE